MTEEWQPLRDHDDYEISTTFPYQIRKRATGKIIAEHLDKDGYLRCHLNLKMYRKHQLIAQQFKSG